MPHSLTQETQFDYVVFVFEIAEIETIQTDIINYEQYHLDKSSLIYGVFK